MAGLFSGAAARRRKRQPGRARSPAKSQLVAVRQHRPMAVWGGRTTKDAERKLVFDARPHPGLLPRGEGIALARLDFSVDRSANPVAGFSRRRCAFLLLLGVKAGMREDVKPIPFGKRFWARRRKRQPGRARSPAMSQLVAVRQHRPMAVWGGRTGHLAFECTMKSKTMKTKIIAILAAVISTSGALAQTNSTVEYRMVGNEKYDVSKPPFISVTIPAGAALANAKEIHYNADAPKPCDLILQIPAIYNYNKPVEVNIKNFPYSPSYFQSGKWQSKNREDLAAAKIIGDNQSHTRSSGPKTALEKKRESEEDALATKSLGDLKRYGTIVDGLVTKEPIALRLFPLSPPRTNFNATGVMSITPARPIFNYGTPVTGKD